MGAAENIITDNLPIWSSAIQSKSSAGRGTSSKRNLYGVKKLRELILDLAVRGLLVPQDPSDESASVLLERIAAEKMQLFKEGKIKKPKLFPELGKVNFPNRTPEGWSWSRLDHIGNVFSGDSINARIKEQKYSNGEGLPFIATKDVGYGFNQLNYHNGVNIPNSENKFKKLKAGAVLICAEGGSAGKKCGINTQDIFFGNKLFAIQLYGNIKASFILINYLSSTFFEQFSTKMTGIIGGISQQQFKNIFIPIPPLAEQHRIVAKVNELMGLCDTLEQQQEDSIQAHETLVEVLLEALSNAVDADTFQAAWGRISEHFDALFTTDHSINKLKETILQLAVTGKLVSQDPSDEPTQSLINTLLSKNKKNQTSQRQSKAVKSDNVLEIPSSWEWVKINDLMRSDRKISYGIIKLGLEPNSGGVPTLRCSDVKPGYIDPSQIRMVRQDIEETYARTRLLGGEVLINIRGTLGGVALVSSDFVGCNIAREVAMLPVDNMLDGHYLVYVLMSPFFWSELNANLRGIAYKGLNLGSLREVLIPIPPLAEQHRIVAKVNELMAICDQLKNSLQQAQETQILLTDALVENAI